jgi:hypothetical protein
MNNFKKRPCKFKFWNGKEFIENENGVFHRWGEVFHEDPMDHQETIGIVEDENGQCHQVSIYLIRFTDK